MDSCPLEVSPEQLDEIRLCEAVVVREYERADGSRYSRLVGWGDKEEMQAAADVPRTFFVRMSAKSRPVSETMILVSDLIDDEELL